MEKRFIMNMLCTGYMVSSVYASNPSVYSQLLRDISVEQSPMAAENVNVPLIDLFQRAQTLGSSSAHQFDTSFASEQAALIEQLATYASQLALMLNAKVLAVKNLEATCMQLANERVLWMHYLTQLQKLMVSINQEEGVRGRSMRVVDRLISRINEQINDFALAQSQESAVIISMTGG